MNSIVACLICENMFQIPKVFVIPTTRLRSVIPRARATNRKGITVATKNKARSENSTSGSVDAVVFVPAGPVPRDSIFKTAITAVRDRIPVVYTLTPEIAEVSDRKTVDGVEGREYTVKVNYDTDLEGAEPVNVDAEIEKLTVPSLNDFATATQVNELPPAADDPK